MNGTFYSFALASRSLKDFPFLFENKDMSLSSKTAVSNLTILVTCYISICRKVE